MSVDFAVYSKNILFVDNNLIPENRVSMFFSKFPHLCLRHLNIHVGASLLDIFIAVLVLPF